MRICKLESLLEYFRSCYVVSVFELSDAVIDAMCGNHVNNSSTIFLAEMLEKLIDTSYMGYTKDLSHYRRWRHDDDSWHIFKTSLVFFLQTHLKTYWCKMSFFMHPAEEMASLQKLYISFLGAIWSKAALVALVILDDLIVSSTDGRGRFVLHQGVIKRCSAHMELQDAL